VNRKELIDYHAGMCKRARELMARKNHDYAGQRGDDQDPFANFRLCAVLRLCSVEEGVLVRLCDKISRLATFATAGNLLVEDEKVEDTVLDIINYAVILAALVKEGKKD